MGEIRLITRKELKEKLDQGDEFILAMTLDEYAFQCKHIQGSICLHNKEDAVKLFEPQEEIVVYCSNELCNASIMTFHYLVGKGFENVRRYAGGLQDWEEAGFPLEGDLVE
jgi:rhodanese-related sulfurtransferase